MPSHIVRALLSEPRKSLSISGQIISLWMSLDDDGSEKPEVRILPGTIFLPHVKFNFDVTIFPEFENPGTQTPHHRCICMAFLMYHCWRPDLFSRKIALGKHILQVFLSETDPGLSFLVSPNAVSLVFPEETAGKHVSNSSFPVYVHLSFPEHILSFARDFRTKRFCTAQSR
jgi:hypothetical protein